MAYDFHVVHSANWTDASSSPITKSDIDAQVDVDLELAWSSSDFVGMADQNGNITRFNALFRIR